MNVEKIRRILNIAECEEVNNLLVEALDNIDDAFERVLAVLTHVEEFHLRRKNAFSKKDADELFQTIVTSYLGEQNASEKKEKLN